MAQQKTAKFRHACGHMQDVWYEDAFGARSAASAHALTIPCRRCASAAQSPISVETASVTTAIEPLAIDVTTDAGAEMSVVKALQDGWTAEEITVGYRLAGRETFRCDGCGRRFPRSLAMNASLGTSCPDCYDDLSG